MHRHSSVALTDADADRILRDMGTVLQNSDSPADVATPVQFVRNGPVRVLPATVAGTIQTQAEWNALMSAGTGVKVVQAIRWCGGPGGSIIGCAPVGNPTVNFAVVRFTANQEGILWVHEYGHNAGNGHRTDDGRAVMFPSIGVDHNVVNGTESGRYLAGPLAITGAVMAMGTACCGTMRCSHQMMYGSSSPSTGSRGCLTRPLRSTPKRTPERLLEWLVDEPDEA